MKKFILITDNEIDPYVLDIIWGESIALERVNFYSSLGYIVKLIAA